jgi:apolipoprotein D and lipocalin family protein
MSTCKSSVDRPDRQPWNAGGLALALLLLAGCASPPKGVTPVTGFDLDRYLGTWYEIARLDHRFERGLTHVTATYSLREDGTVRVFNRGFDTANQEWSSIEGSAVSVEEPDVAALKVTFFAPFYGGYFVIELDEDYQHALVSGPTRNYLWILARTPDLDEATYTSLVDQARDLGYAVDDLIRVEQADPPPDP